MGNVIKFWNLIYYMLYKWANAVHDVFNLFFKFIFGKSEFISKSNSKSGFDDHFKMLDKLHKDINDGINIVSTGGIMGGFIVIFQFSLMNLFQFYFKIQFYSIIIKNKYYLFVLLIVLLAITGFLNNILLFRKNRYKCYFKKFDMIYEENKLKYNIIFALFIVSVLTLFFLSLALLLPLLRNNYIDSLMVD